MLAQLTISDFAIVRKLEIDFQTGMTTITGETGAGKSIAIDALGLCLGNRCEAAMVRHGAQRADVCARFSLKDAPAARLWLETNQLDDDQECLLRRVINNDGRSRGFINGTAVPLSQLRELGQLLIQIHGQNDHQLLLKPDQQKALLDGFINQMCLLNAMREAWHNWHNSRSQLLRLQQQQIELQAQYQLLQYQLKELDEFAPQIGEYEQNDIEYKRLANSGQLLTLSQETLHLLVDGDQQTVSQILNNVKQHIETLVSIDPQLSNLLTMLDDASIQISEASDELRHYVDQMEIDPSRMSELEQRLSRQLTLARKHHIRPEELPALYQQLSEDYQKLASQDDDIAELQSAVDQYHAHALEIAKQLHESRSQYAKELSDKITDSIHNLSMEQGQFKIDVTWQPDQLSEDGADKVNFYVSTNVGQPLHALHKVASGGELSRIALAIQVITARKMDTPALIFDEIDTGISGPTAAIVGKLLRELGESTQVMCVTHLPQVAGCGHHHFFVSKQTQDNSTETQMILLDKSARIQELARLLGGKEITKHTLANAKELLTH